MRSAPLFIRAEQRAEHESVREDLSADRERREMRECGAGEGAIEKEQERRPATAHQTHSRTEKKGRTEQEKKVHLLISLSCFPVELLVLLPIPLSDRAEQSADGHRRKANEEE